MNEELGFQKIMVRTLRSINKLLEIALLVYIFAFSLLKKMGPLLAMLLELGGKLGLTLQRNFYGSSGFSMG
ncbi:hypothetical protein HKBW3S03_01613, partial [Candidatus Hakubella thermalkaliphila]